MDKRWMGISAECRNDIPVQIVQKVMKLKRINLR